MTPKYTKDAVLRYIAESHGVVFHKASVRSSLAFTCTIEELANGTRQVVFTAANHDRHVCAEDHISDYTVAWNMAVDYEAYLANLRHAPCEGFFWGVMDTMSQRE